MRRYIQFNFYWISNFKHCTFITIIFDGILISYLHSSLNFPYIGFFWHIGFEYVDRPIGNDVETIKGNRKLHSIKTNLSTNAFAMDKRKYSCFFHVWIGNIESNDVCENKIYVKDWQNTKLNTKWKMYVANFEEMKLEETTVSSEGYRVYDLVREGNISNDFK